MSMVKKGNDNQHIAPKLFEKFEFEKLFPQAKEPYVVELDATENEHRQGVGADNCFLIEMQLVT